MNKLIQMHYLPNLKSSALLIDSANLPDVLYTLMFNSGIVSLCTEAFVEHGKLMPKKNQAECYTLIKFADKKVLCQAVNVNLLLEVGIQITHDFVVSLAFRHQWAGLVFFPLG